MEGWNTHFPFLKLDWWQLFGRQVKWNGMVCHLQFSDQTWAILRRSFLITGVGSKNEGIKSNLSEITINYSIPKLFTLNEQIIHSHTQVQENARRSWNHKKTFEDSVTSRVTRPYLKSSQRLELSWSSLSGFLLAAATATGGGIRLPTHPQSWLSNCSGAWSVLIPA